MGPTDLPERLAAFNRKSYALKPYNADTYGFAGEGRACPYRLAVSPYVGCNVQCRPCPVWSERGAARPKENFRTALVHDIERAKGLGLGGFLTMLSPSTEPFDPLLERQHRHSGFALEQLLGNGFPVLVMTRYPAVLRDPAYAASLDDPRLFIDVSIPSLHQNDPGSFFFSRRLPPLEEDFAAMRGLADRGKHVRVKVEPVVPTVGAIRGQTAEELDEIVHRSQGAGARGIISKTMRLNSDVPRRVYHELIDYYEAHGSLVGINRILLPGERRRLLLPVLEACKRYGIPFSGCVDADTFEGDESLRCFAPGESDPG